MHSSRCIQPVADLRTIALPSSGPGSQFSVNADGTVKPWSFGANSALVVSHTGSGQVDPTYSAFPVLATFVYADGSEHYFAIEPGTTRILIRERVTSMAFFCGPDAAIQVYVWPENTNTLSGEAR